MGPCRVGEEDRAISIGLRLVGGSERETLLRPHHGLSVRGVQENSKKGPPPSLRMKNIYEDPLYEDQSRQSKIVEGAPVDKIHVVCLQIRMYAREV